IVEAFTIAVVGIFLVVLDPIAVPISVGILGCLGLGLQRFFLRRIVRLGAASRQYQTSMMQWANQALGGIKEIQILGCEDYFLDRFTHDVAANANALRDYRVTALVPRYVLETLGVSGIVVVSYLILARGADETTLLPILGVFAIAVVRI